MIVCVEERCMMMIVSERVEDSVERGARKDLFSRMLLCESN